MADDGLQHSNISKDSDEILNSRSILLKTIQVLLDLVAVGLIIEPFDSFQQIFNKPRVKIGDIAIIYITIAGYIMINGLFVISHFLGDRLPKRTTLLFTLMGTLLHVVAGSLMIHNWRKLGGDYAYVYNNAIYPSKLYMDMLISSSVFTFVNAIIYGVDVFLTIKYF